MKLGIIGGSGVYSIEGLENIEVRDIDTPFGKPSDSYVTGVLNGIEVCFLPRHGSGHSLLPSEINYRANIFGMKVLGVDRIVSISAVGSLKESLRPGDIVLPNQYFDRTKNSAGHTFFGNGVVAHVSFGDPTCAALGKVVATAARKVVADMPDKDTRIVEGGTYVNMEGPAFSTRAESNFNRSFGFDVIGMTSLAEAKLCREAEICYQTMAMVTDYDCWRETEEAVTVEMVIATVRSNAEMSRNIVQTLVSDMPETLECSCHSSLENALMTMPDAIPEEMKKSLAPIIGKYV
jgi:5'-methylthioadenosine phosphorylase